MFTTTTTVVFLYPETARLTSAGLRNIDQRNKQPAREPLKIFRAAHSSSLLLSMLYK